MKMYLFIAGTALLAGCASLTPLPGAEQVVITDKATPKTCQHVGQITDTDVHGISGNFKSMTTLQQEDRVYLKNQAVRIGANRVVLKSHQAIIAEVLTPTPTKGGARLRSTITRHRVIAEAYQCP